MNRFKILKDEKPQPKVLKPPAPDTFPEDFKERGNLPDWVATQNLSYPEWVARRLRMMRDHGYSKKV